MAKIIRDASNQDEMEKKLLQREEEQLAKVKERRKVETEPELLEIAKKELVTRSSKHAESRKPLKDRQVIINPQSKDIHAVMQQVKAIPKAEPTSLKGRVKPQQGPQQA